MAWTRDLPRNHWGPWLSAAHARPRRSSTQTASDRAKKDLQKGRVPQICARPRVNAPAAMQEGGADARKVFGGDRAAYIYPATAGNMHRPPARRARHPHPPRHVQQGPRLRGSDTQLAPARPRSSRQHAPAAGAPCSWTSTVRMPLCACAQRRPVSSCQLRQPGSMCVCVGGGGRRASSKSKNLKFTGTTHNFPVDPAV